MATDQSLLFFKEQAQMFTNYCGADIPAEISAFASVHSPSDCQAYEVSYLDSRSMTEITTEPTSNSASVAQGFQQRWIFKSFWTDIWQSSILSQNQSAILKTLVPGVRDKQQKAVKVTIHKQLVTALTGTAKTGASGGTSTALPATQKIAKNYVASGTAVDSGLTLDKVDAAKVKLESDPLWSPDDELIIMLTTGMESALIAEIRATNAYDRGFIENGRLTSLCGMKVYKSSQLPVASGVRSAIAYNKKCAAVAIWSDENVYRIDPVTTNHYRTQVYARVGIGATRLHETGVVEILCAE